MGKEQWLYSRVPPHRCSSSLTASAEDFSTTLAVVTSSLQKILRIDLCLTYSSPDYTRTNSEPPALTATVGKQSSLLPLRAERYQWKTYAIAGLITRECVV